MVWDGRQVDVQTSGIELRAHKKPHMYVVCLVSQQCQEQPWGKSGFSTNTAILVSLYKKLNRIKDLNVKFMMLHFASEISPNTIRRLDKTAIKT